MTKKTRCRFPDEFKADAVSLVIDQGSSVSEAARRLGLERSMLDRWCRKHRQQITDTPGRQDDDRDIEIKKLREEVRKLQIEKDILKRWRPSSPKSRAEIPVHRVGEGHLRRGRIVSGHAGQPEWFL